MHFSRKLIAIAAVGAASLIGVGPALAESPSDAAVVVGTGTITPGLPLTGCTSGQSVSFDGTAAAAGDETGTYSVSFRGSSDTCESLQSGHGSGTLSGGLSGNVTYNRTGNVVTLTGSVTVGGEVHVLGPNAFVFVPTSASPTASYALAGTVELDS
jgi:hypothetical protein